MLAQLGDLPPALAQDVTPISFSGWGGAALTSLGMNNTQMIDSGRLAMAVDG